MQTGSDNSSATRPNSACDNATRDNALRLRANIEALSAKDREFATSLLGSLDRGRCSDKQAYWIGKLADRATQPKESEGGERRPYGVAIGSMAGILSLFDAAARNLKRPAIVLAGPEGQGIKLSIAGQSAKVPGSIIVTDRAPYGEAQWYGRVLRDGTFQNGRAKTPAWLLDLLARFAAEPGKVAAEYGRLRGVCCFCNRPLTDARSTAAGYGPNCAQHYGLAEAWAKATGALPKPPKASRTKAGTAVTKRDYQAPLPLVAGLDCGVDGVKDAEPEAPQ